MTSYLLQNILDGDIKVFYHLVYEYDKGVRPFVLYTMEQRFIPLAEKKLNAYNISYFIKEIEGSNSVNLFFGNDSCVTIMKQILAHKTIEDLSPEEDFILGTILGYDIPRQCERYCKRKKKETSTTTSDELNKKAI